MIMKSKKLNDKKLVKIRGRGYGFFLNEQQAYDYSHDIHYGCGGHILHHGDPFSKCECDKCHVRHYWYNDFFTFIPSGEGPYF